MWDMSEKLTMEELLLRARYSAKVIKLYLNNVGFIENSDITLTYTGLTREIQSPFT
jgi:hypothetical protein